MDNLERIRKTYDEQMIALQERMKQEANAILSGIFEDHPKLLGFGWTQYTPRFNDGEECVFSVNFDIGESPIIFEHEAFLSLDEDQCDSMEVTHNGVTYYSQEDYNLEDKIGTVKFTRKNWRGDDYEVTDPALPEDILAARTAIHNLFLNVPDEVWKMMFGDHCIVEVTRDGITVDSYDHD